MFGPRDIASIGVDDIEVWFKSRNEKPVTRRANLGRLSSLFDYAWRKGLVKENITKRVERIRVEKAPPPILTVEQARVVMQTAGWRWGAFCALALFAGVRPEELSRVSWADIDLQRGILRLSESQTKTHRRRVVHLTPNCIEWLRRGGTLPISLQSKRNLHHHLRYALGLDHWPQDSMRHSCASYKLAIEESAEKVSLELGNQTAILKRHYMELVSREDAIRFFNIFPP
jgi:integrase